MCGIWAHISSINKDYYEYFKKISHRGPDASNYMKLPELAIGFHRLAIVEKSFKGMQPFLDKNLIFVCNGEIYNYLDLNCKYKIENCNNDCQCILELYKKWLYKINKNDKLRCSIIAGHYNFNTKEYKILIENLQKYKKSINNDIINSHIEIINHYVKNFY